MTEAANSWQISLVSDVTWNAASVVIHVKHGWWYEKYVENVFLIIKMVTSH
jgi:hypothetical protein